MRFLIWGVSVATWAIAFAGCASKPAAKDEHVDPMVDSVEKAFEAARPKFADCYAKASGESHPIGKVVAEIEVGGGGKVRSAGVKSTTLNSPPIESCLIATIRGMRFPEPPDGGKINLTYPFSFSGK